LLYSVSHAVTTQQAKGFSMTASNVVTYNVLLASKGAVEIALTALAKRGSRRGLPALTWAWGKASTTIELVPNRMECAPCTRFVRETANGVQVEVDRIELNLPVYLPKLQGWRFVASLQHLDDTNIVHVVPGESIPANYRERGPWCDHCNSERRRNDTYVLAHDDGKTVQVGSSCIRDFLGNDAPANIAAQASLAALIPSSIEAAERDGFGGRGGGYYMLAPFLTNVAAAVREVGWVSRKAARERDVVATATVVTRVLDNAIDAPYTVEDCDNDTAAHAAEWAETLSDEAVNALSAGEFLHNVRTIARNGFVDHRTVGMSAAIITAYQRAVGDRARWVRAAASVHVGKVGVRETFFDLTLDSVNGYATDYGYTTVLTFVNTNGAIIVWKASNTEISRADVGKRFDVTASVKSHGEYKGVLQTYITRAKVEAA